MSGFTMLVDDIDKLCLLHGTEGALVVLEQRVDLEFIEAGLNKIIIEGF